MRAFRIFAALALLFAFCLRAGGQQPISRYHLTLGPEWATDIVSGQDVFVWIDIDRTSTVPSYSALVYRAGYDAGSQMQIKTVGQAIYDAYAILGAGDIVLSNVQGVFSVSYSAKWVQIPGTLGGSFASQFMAAQDAGFVYLPPNRGADNLFLPVSNVYLYRMPEPAKKRGR